MLKTGKAGRIIENEVCSKLLLVDRTLVEGPPISQDSYCPAIGTQLLLVLKIEPPTCRTQVSIDHLSVLGCVGVPESDL